MLVSCRARPSWCASSQPGPLLHAEDAHRQTPDRAGHPVAIEIERREIGRADVGVDIHLHAVDHGQEIRLPQAEVADRVLRKLACARRPVGVESGKIGAPPVELPCARCERGRVPSSAMSSTMRQKL